MRSLVLVLALGCGPRPIPAGTADQSLADAMHLVCDAPARADRDRGEGTRSDKIAGHLTDGIGHQRVLVIVEGWKTDGINRAELDRLVKDAKLSSCALKHETP